jgi:hypothetical protein
MSCVLTHVEAPPERPHWLAWAPGFEPGYGGVKIPLHLINTHLVMAATMTNLSWPSREKLRGLQCRHARGAESMRSAHFDALPSVLQQNKPRHEPSLFVPLCASFVPWNFCQRLVIKRGELLTHWRYKYSSSKAPDPQIRSVNVRRPRAGTVLMY